MGGVLKPHDMKEIKNELLKMRAVVNNVGDSLQGLIMTVDLAQSNLFSYGDTYDVLEEDCEKIAEKIKEINTVFENFYELGEDEDE